MKLRIAALVSLVAVLASAPASADTYLVGPFAVALNGVTATTTSDTFRPTGGVLHFQVWCPTGTPNATVTLQERVSESPAAPWKTVLTLEDCDSAGDDSGGNMCYYKTATPGPRVRVVCTWTSGTYYAVLWETK